jgi:RNA polymerase sigma factor (TIGR02999 family)
MADVTQVLSRLETGDTSAAEELLSLVYDELRKLAAQRLSQEKPGQTLQATALVHEAYMRLLGSNEVEPRWVGRAHFFAAAAEAMRRILVENARRKGRIRHGGQFQRVELVDVPLSMKVSEADLIAVHDVLDGLEQIDAQAAELVKLHYFLGLTMDEIAQMLGISPRTAYRTWSFARAWLYQHLARETS